MSSVREVFLYPNGNMNAVGVRKLRLGEIAFYITPSVVEQDGRVNQDSLAIIELSDRSIVLAIADGAGGHRGGAKASRTAITTLVDSLSESDQSDSWKSVLLHSIDSANEAVSGLGVGAASTFMVAHINQQGLRPYHVGDSGSLVVGQRGKIKLQTVSHSPTGYALESGLLDEESALKHEDRNIVSNLLGSEEMHIQIGGRVKLSRRDTVLLASDGVFDNLRRDEIVSLIRKGKLVKVLEKLIDKSHERMLNAGSDEPSKADDLSVILYRPVAESQRA